MFKGIHRQPCCNNQAEVSHNLKTASSVQILFVTDDPKNCVEYSRTLQEHHIDFQYSDPQDGRPF